MAGSGIIGTICAAVASLALAGAADAQPAAPASPQAAYRTDTVELALPPSGREGSEIDYPVKMKAGDVLVYSWSVEGVARPDEFYSSFEGMTAPPRTPDIVRYRDGTGTAAAGSLAAPFDGTHAWLFKNDSLKPVKVTLVIAGFYELPSLRESMGLEGPAYIPFGPPGWPDRFGPAKK